MVEVGCPGETWEGLGEGRGCYLWPAELKPQARSTSLQSKAYLLPFAVDQRKLQVIVLDGFIGPAQRREDTFSSLAADTRPGDTPPPTFVRN